MLWYATSVVLHVTKHHLKLKLNPIGQFLYVCYVRYARCAVDASDRSFTWR
jgi:hypothetical protein